MNCPGCGEYTSWRYVRCGNCGTKLPQPKGPEDVPSRPGPVPGPMPGTGMKSPHHSPVPEVGYPGLR